MVVATLIFPGWNWLWFASGALGLAVALLFWAYRATPPGPWRWLCVLLKTLGLAALCCCLLDPLWSGERARPGANLFLIVADNSQGLQIKDRGATRTRGELLRELLDPNRARWQQNLEENFELRRYSFDARLQTIADFNELTFDGRASAIGAALRTVAERYRGRPVAGVLLLTDGNATDIRGAPDLTGLPPVYPVVLGNLEPIKDLAVQQVAVTQTAFEDAPVSIQADILATGFQGSSVVTEILNAAGKIAAEQSLKPRKDSELLPFRFSLRPETAGLCFYRVRVRAKDAPGGPNAASKSQEATLANNSTVVAVNRGRGPYRILYVAGRPNWEFKFLNRALEVDDQLQLSGLIRVAKREPKFNFLGRAGETSNPLFRGFDRQSPEEVERYDQPVLARTRNDIEVRGGFPRTAEELYNYHAVIIDDLEAEFFTAEQSALLQKFVSERGGGLLMLGGMESFQQGKYQRTPIGDMLPVYLPNEEWIPPSAGLRLNLTTEGWLQPWVRLRDNEAGENTRLQSMVPFQVLNPVREVKPGASIMATVAATNGVTYPALVVQRFGRGRTAALLLGDVWRWGMHDAAAHEDMDKAWRQLVRWLVNDAPERVEFTTETQPNDPNGAVALQVRVRDPKFQPLDNANISLEAQLAMTDGAAGSQTNSIHLSVEPSAAEPGLYQATYVPRATGGYRASACVTNSEGVEVGRAVAGWSTDLAAEEFRSLAPNVPLLETIARATGGEIVPADKLEPFTRRLPHLHAPVMESWTFPLWHTPAMFGFALACLLSEWGLRRWRGMP
jgi:uncharacterized membrane protein